MPRKQKKMILLHVNHLSLYYFFKRILYFCLGNVMRSATKFVYKTELISTMSKFIPFHFSLIFFPPAWCSYKVLLQEKNLFILRDNSVHYCAAYLDKINQLLSFSRTQSLSNFVLFTTRLWYKYTTSSDH